MSTINIEQAKLVASDVRGQVVAGRRVDLVHRDVTAQRCGREKCTKRLKDVETNSGECCLVNGAGIGRA